VNWLLVQVEVQDLSWCVDDDVREDQWF